VTGTTQHPLVDDDEGVLEAFLTQVVVDDYSGVEPREDTRPWWARHWPAFAVLALIGLLIATVVISTRTSDEVRQQTRDELIARVSDLAAAVDAQEASVAEQSASVDALQAQVLSARAGGSEEAGRIASLSAQAGTTALAGPGVTVTIDDAPDAAAGSLNRVLDRDVQDIVNALWSMGASGVAVNGQRLTAATAIRGAGEAILANYQPLTRPYTVSAVGTAPTDGSPLTSLLSGLSTDYGLVSEVSSGDVALPAGELRTPRFARFEGEGAQP
jgi:uncharacterized protein YlxW (UPF0749 family)